MSKLLRPLHFGVRQEILSEMDMRGPRMNHNVCANIKSGIKVESTWFQDNLQITKMNKLS